jgi:hypothetical protein
MGDDSMHHIINDGSTTDDTYTQEEGETIVDDEEEAVEEGGEYEEDDEPVVAATALPAPTAKGKKKAAPKKGGGSRGPKWQPLEDGCLAEVWKKVSIDPISGANQNPDMYWERVKVSFDERKLMDPTFNKMHMDHNPSGMSHRWGIMLPFCSPVGICIYSHNVVLRPYSCCRCLRCSKCTTPTMKTSNSSSSMY